MTGNNERKGEMKPTIITSATCWCETCGEYIDATNPAARLSSGQVSLVVCLACLRTAVVACEEKVQSPQAGGRL